MSFPLFFNEQKQWAHVGNGSCKEMSVDPLLYANVFLFIVFLFLIFLKFIFERASEQAWAGEGQRERETPNPK